MARSSASRELKRLIGVDFYRRVDKYESILVALGTVWSLRATWPWLKKLALASFARRIVIDRPGSKFFFPTRPCCRVAFVIFDCCWVDAALLEAINTCRGHGRKS